MTPAQRFSPKVRTVVAALFLLVLVLPFLVVGALRLYWDALLQHTETVLISEAVVVGEIYRRAAAPKTARGPLTYIDGEHYHPFLPKLDPYESPILAPAERRASASRTASDAADLHDLLRRSVVRNLSGIRIVDRAGIVVASSTRETNYSLAHLPEVEAALAGGYLPVLRRRYSDEDAPPLSSLSRAGKVRVSLAVPIYRNPAAPVGTPDIIGAVYSSRTPLGLSKALWAWRDRLIVPILISVVITLLLGAVLTFMISKPLRRIRNSAEKIAEGDPTPLEPGAWGTEEIHALAASIARMQEELEKRAQYIREFAANAAHELKTPLTSVRGAAELLLENEDMDPDKRRRFLSNMHEDAVRMDGLVHGILDLARIEASRPQRKPVDVPAYLEATAERYRRRGHDIGISHFGSAEISYAPEQLDTLVCNLLDNAVRHSGGGAVEAEITQDAKGTILRVSNDGQALTEAELDRVFERFYSTARSSGGTGLGLAIVKAIAEAHGGKVWAVPRPDGGATFSVLLAEVV